MPIIVPAILEETESSFLDKVSRVTKISGVKNIQVDFGDGKFIKRALLPVTAINPLNPAFIWEAHLMVKEPKDFLDYKIAGFSIIIIHYEAFEDSRDLHEAVQLIKDQGLKASIAINPGTPVGVLKDFEKTVNQFLVMGVHPGYQGQAYLEQTGERISQLRKLASSVIIEVDGGINMANAKSAAVCGADLLVAGSSLVKAPNMQEAFDKLSAEINKR
jgi:ribulose-phosphate 3-epimerase